MSYLNNQVFTPYITIWAQCRDLLQSENLFFWDKSLYNPVDCKIILKRTIICKIFCIIQIPLKLGGLKSIFEKM